MKTDHIISFGQAVFAAAALGLASPVFAQDAPTGLPPTAAPAAPAAIAPPSADFEDEVAPPRPRERRKEVRILRGVPGKRVQIEERDEHGDVMEELDHAPTVVFEDRFDVMPPAGPKRIFRYEPGNQRDIVVRNFRGQDGPIISARAEVGTKAGHVDQAIHHLHAAGMHDLAEKAEARAEKMRAEAGDAGELRSQLEDLKREHDQLKKQIKKLQQSTKAGKPDDSEELKKP